MLEHGGGISVVMSNELSVNERETIRGLLRLGWSVRHIARETGHSREAISRCKNRAETPEPQSSDIPEAPADSPQAKAASSNGDSSDDITVITERTASGEDREETADDVPCVSYRSVSIRNDMIRDTIPAPSSESSERQDACEAQ